MNEEFYFTKFALELREENKKYYKDQFDSNPYFVPDILGQETTEGKKRLL